MTQKSQYASSVIHFSSEFDSVFNSAKEALDAPDIATTSYGDNANAWTAKSESINGSIETLTLGFDTPVYANGVTIWESYGNGFVTQIEVLSTDNNYSPVWSGTDTSVAGAVAEFAVSFDKTSFLVKGVRVTVNTDHSNSYEEIDAVQLRGDTESSTPVNQAPTDISLNKTNIDENVAAGSVIGTLSSTDPDAGDSFSYSLVSGSGSGDNSAFSITSNQLKINVSPDFETKNSYSIRVRTTDQGGASFENALTITINDLNETSGKSIYGDANGTPTADFLSGSDLSEKIYGKDLMDTLSGGLGNDTLYGGYDNDLLLGQEGNDQLFGEQDDDSLNGGAGKDTLDGGFGIDTMVGSDGNDTYYLSYDAPDVIEDKGLVSDTDTVIMPYQMNSYRLVLGIENAEITSGTGLSNLTGNISDNALKGNDGKNVLKGNGGDDTLIGGVGNDGLQGGNAADVLIGNTGNDLLNGGAGSDRLTGGTGRDIFKFNHINVADVDRITDFNVNADTVQLENNIFTTLTNTGVLLDSAFTIATDAATANNRIIYNSVTGGVYYDDDGNGSHPAVQIATIGVNLALTNTDFVVV